MSPTPSSPSTPASRSTSVIPTAPGSGPRTRTPTDCCANTCPRAPTFGPRRRRSRTVRLQPEQPSPQDARIYETIREARRAPCADRLSPPTSKWPHQRGAGHLDEVKRLEDIAREATGLFWLRQLDEGCTLPWNYFAAWVELVILDRILAMSSLVSSGHRAPGLDSTQSSHSQTARTCPENQDHTRCSCSGSRALLGVTSG